MPHPTFSYTSGSVFVRYFRGLVNPQKRTNGSFFQYLKRSPRAGAPLAV